MTDAQGRFMPMRAATLEDVAKQLTFPVLASPKFDGIRCVVRDGVALSNNLKPIPNPHVQARLGCKALNGFDGELIVGSPTEGEVLNRTRAVMAKQGQPDFKYHVFDDFSVHARDFNYRLGRAEDRVDDIKAGCVQHVSHELIHSIPALVRLEKVFLLAGYEGVMLRSPSGLYKFGRATPLEGTLWKLKRFTDGEALIMGIEEGNENQNEAEQDAFGHVKRSSAKAGKVAAGRVGVMICKDMKTGQTVRVSPGKLTAAERVEWWEDYLRNPREVRKRIIKYKFFDYGLKDAPRFATFVAVRDPADMPVAV
jgi:DNA ligase 1